MMSLNNSATSKQRVCLRNSTGIINTDIQLNKNMASQLIKMCMSGKTEKVKQIILDMKEV